MGLSIDEFLKNRSQFTDAEDVDKFYVGSKTLNSRQAQRLLNYCEVLSARVDNMDDCCSWDEAECEEAHSVLSCADDIRNIIRGL